MELIDLLQSIQDNLVGIVLPVLITAFVTVLSILVNVIMQILLQNSNINNEQYKLMQTFYPGLRLGLLEAKLSMKEVKSNPIYTDMENAINKYTEYRQNDANYIKNNESEIENIDGFITSLNNYSDKIVSIKKNFNDYSIPRTPIMHPLFKRKVNKMLTIVWYYSLLWNEYKDNHITTNIFLQEIKDFKKNWGVELNYERLEEYIDLLDEWFLKY